MTPGENSVFNHRQNFAGARIALILALAVGLIGVTPAAAQVDRAMSDFESSTVLVQVQTPSYPVPINSGETTLVPFRIAGAETIAGTITGRTYQFFTQYDVPLSEAFGPFPASIQIDASGTASWDEAVYLPKAVADEARSTKDYAIVLKSTFHGSLQTGASFRADSSLLLLLPPDAFGKVSPSNGAIVPPGGLSLQWNSSIGAVDYDYCFDTIDNDSCDSNWTGTYWQGTYWHGTYITNAALQNLPPGTTVYWQVRANNTSGTTYADNGDWWQFTTASATSPIHVKWNATGANDGSSWENAFTDLQSALAAAPSGAEIWVAAGTYKPTSGTDRTISFVLKNDVAMYGGFAGMETSLLERDYSNNVTILSGDLGTTGLNNDNSYHVIVASNTNNSAILDGFTVTAGNANGSGVYEQGGAIYTADGGPTWSHLIIRGNSGGIGTGIYNYNSSPTLTDMIFVDNSGFLGSRGGAIVNDFNSSPSLTNVTFLNNTGVWVGGAMLNSFDSNPYLVNITFVGNSASTRGGAIYNWESNPTLINATFSGNSATYGGAIFNDSYSHTTVINSILYGNTGGEIDNYSGAATVSYSIVQGGHTGTGNLDADPLLGPLQDNGGFTQTMALGMNSPAINHGDQTNCPATDQRGVARPQNGGCDIGAYEYVFSPVPTITNTATTTASITPTTTLTFTPTNTRTPTVTSTPSLTRTPTMTRTPTRTRTPSPTRTPTVTASLIPTHTATPTPTFTQTASFTPTTVVPYTATATRTPTRAAKPSRTPSPTQTPVSTSTNTPTRTATSIAVSSTPTWTPSYTPTATVTRTFTPTPTSVSTNTFTPSPFPTTSGGFPTTAVRDNFNRADGPIGGSWTGNPSAFGIASNQLDMTASGTDTFILWKAPSFGADQEAYVTLAQPDTTAGNEHRLILKSQHNKKVTAGLISVVYDAAGQTVQVWTYHPTQGWVQHGTSISAVFVNGDQFGARARPDGTVEVYRNGTLLGIWDITSWPFYNAGGYIGLWCVDAPNALLDDFGGGTR